MLDGESRWDQAKLSLTRWDELGALPSLLDGAERSLMGHCERYATGLLVQGCTSPPPSSSFRVEGLLSRVPVLAAYAHNLEPGLGEAASREATAPRDV